MRLFFFQFFIFYVGFCYCQSQTRDYNCFTPERRQVLNKMGEFFDETIRKNFPAKIDTMSYYYFHNCFWQTGAEGFHIVLDIDRAKLKEINQILFKDHNYYFFYAKYIYMGQIPDEFPFPSFVDSVPTDRRYGRTNIKKYIITPVLNQNGYIKVMPDDNLLIKQVKEDIALAGVAPTPTSWAIVQDMWSEVSNPQVKEYLAVMYWKYICILAGIDLEERKPICEMCDL